MVQASGGRDLVFTVYPYPTHSSLVVTLRHHKPLAGRDMLLGRMDLAIGREDLAGLSSHLAVRLVAVSILNAIPAEDDRPKAPAPPDGGHGGEQVEGQLRLDLPD